MTQRRICALVAAMSAVATVALIGTAPAASAHRAAPGIRSTQQCAAGPTPIARKSRYNTTPAGRGPWQVPHDPCNTEPMMHFDNCAYWAEEKRPDIWRQAVMRRGGGYSHGVHGAWNVELDAKKFHFRVNHKPKAGDVVAWPPNAVMGTERSGSRTITHYASAGGHVAYVEKAHHKRIVISSTGLDTVGGYTFRLKFNKHKTFFIHRGRTR